MSITFVDSGRHAELLGRGGERLHPAQRHAVTRHQLSVSVISDLPGLLRLEPVWRDLAERAGLDHPFLSHECVRTAWECFGERNMLHVLLLADEQGPVGIAPLMLGYERICGLRMRRMGFIYSVPCERMGFIVARRVAEAHLAIWRHLVRRSDLWDVLLLQQIPAGSQAAADLRKYAAEDRFIEATWSSSEAPLLAIHGAWEEYEKSLDNKFRSNIRNRFRRLTRRAQVAHEVVSGGTEVDAALEDGFRIEAAAWKGKHGTAIASDVAVRRFYSTLARRAARRGWLRLHFLRADGHRIAFAYMLHCGDVLYLLKIGYDPGYAAYSPATLLLHTILREAFEHRLSGFEFLGQYDDWKREWTRGTTPHLWLYLFSDTIRARLVHAAKFRLLPQIESIGMVAGLKSALLRSFGGGRGRAAAGRIA